MMISDLDWGRVRSKNNLFYFSFSASVSVLSHETNIGWKAIGCSLLCHVLSSFNLVFCFYRFSTKWTTAMCRTSRFFLSPPHRSRQRTSLAQLICFEVENHFSFSIHSILVQYFSESKKKIKNKIDPMSLEGKFWPYRENEHNSLPQQFKVEFLMNLVKKKVGKISISINFVIKFWILINFSTAEIFIRISIRKAPVHLSMGEWKSKILFLHATRRGCLSLRRR